jgi:hypothetical protein
MSGPIVRKYGFPNFEQIFGKRELEHGVDETEDEGQGSKSEKSSASSKKAPASKPKKASKPKSKKS